MTGTKAFELVIACVVTFVTLGLAHFLCTWKLALGRRVKPPWTYVVGVLMLLLPWGALVYRWGYGEAAVAMAAVTASGGAAVGGGYLLLDRVLLRDENKKLRAHLDRAVEEGSDGGGKYPES